MLIRKSKEEYLNTFNVPLQPYHTQLETPYEYPPATLKVIIVIILQKTNEIFEKKRRELVDAHHKATLAFHTKALEVKNLSQELSFLISNAKMHPRTISKVMTQQITTSYQKVIETNQQIELICNDRELIKTKWDKLVHGKQKIETIAKKLNETQIVSTVLFSKLCKKLALLKNELD